MLVPQDKKSVGSAIYCQQALEIVELASLLHDIQDWKYSGSETVGAATAQV